MKTRNLLMTTAILAAVLAFNGESFARGGMGGGKGIQLHTRTQTQTQTRTRLRTATQTTTQTQDQTTQVRPEGSQRRDGTFLLTGTTANGSTTRPSRGHGVMDGTGINTTTP